MTPLEMTSAVTALANALACGRTAEEIALMASLFVQLGDTMATVAAAGGLCDTQK